MGNHPKIQSTNAGHTEGDRGTNERSMSHEAGHALTAYDYGFGADEFLVEVANDPTGATYRGRIGLRFVSDEEIKKMGEAKRRCYGIVCAAGARVVLLALMRRVYFLRILSLPLVRGVLERIRPKILRRRLPSPVPVGPFRGRNANDDFPGAIPPAFVPATRRAEMLPSLW